MRRKILKVTLAGIGFMTTMGASAQQAAWPERPVRLIVSLAPGGGVDALARALGQQLSIKWGKPVVVENKPGANTSIAAEAVAHSNDGHTLLVTADQTFTINPHLYPKLPYTLGKDLAPVTMVASFHQVLVAPASLPANNLKEVIALAKKDPNGQSYASWGSGSQPHLAMEMLKRKAGINIVHVPYRGVPMALNAVLSNEVSFTFSGIASARPQITSKRIKPIAVSGSKRIPQLPNVPTFTELGFPEVEAKVWVGVFAPQSMNTDLVRRIDADIKSVMSDKEFLERQLAARGFEAEVRGTDELKKYIDEELKARGVLVKNSGAKVD